MQRNAALILILIALPFAGLAVVKMTNRTLYTEDGYVARDFSAGGIVSQGGDVVDLMTSKSTEEVVEKYSERHNMTKEEAKDILREKAKMFLNDAEIDQVQRMEKDEALGFAKTKAKEYLGTEEEKF